MTEPPPIDPIELTVALRSLLHEEVERVDDPGVIPEDRAGWHALRPVAVDAAGAPHYEPESWRWFDLIDVAFVDEMVLVVFRWTDPSTPELRYSTFAHADGLANAETAALIVRGQLRRLLEPGWRDRVAKRWLSRSKVLVWREPSRAGRPPDRLAELRQEMYDTAWTAGRAPRTG